MPLQTSSGKGGPVWTASTGRQLSGALRHERSKATTRRRACAKRRYEICAELCIYRAEDQPSLKFAATHQS